MTMHPSNKRPAEHSRRFILGGLVLVFLYVLHLWYCQNSALPFLDYVFSNSDMNANLHWAMSIKTQGWLNPVPYHPYTGWMQKIAPYSQWVQWWGGEQIFQQSPLYAYLLALLPDNYHYCLLARIAQAAMSAGVCILLGLLTNRIAGRNAGWIAFLLAAVYAPFYAYSWPLLRDGLGWFITSALLLALVELTRSEWPSRVSRQLGWIVGALLGFGYLAREFYLLLIPAVCVVLGIFAWKRHGWDVLTRVVIALVLTLSPLVLRNYCVGAPLLSSSNRFVESFIVGNSAGSHPYLFVIPAETKQILYQTRGNALSVIQATIASHPSFWDWVRLQFGKVLSLLDPYESPDNLSFYFMETISPLVRFGLRYWMILIPALAGLFLTVYRRERAHLWLWLFLPVILATMLVGQPVSRYRQSLAILFIPWAACFLSFLGDLIRRHEFRKAGYYGVALFVGWVLVLGPLSRQPLDEYERPAEYLLSSQIYHQHGEAQKELEMQDLIRQKFPSIQPRLQTGGRAGKSSDRTIQRDLKPVE